jgi:orotate phosphoribosyltransferase
MEPQIKIPGDEFVYEEGMHGPRVLEILEEVDAIQHGHFEYTSGNHGEAYVNKDALYPYPHLLSEVCGYMAMPFKDDDIEVVVGPAMGGILLANNTAQHLNMWQPEGRVVHAIYAEKALVSGTSGFAFTRGYQNFVQGKRVLVVEDNLTTGDSVSKVVNIARAAGGYVVGVSAMCNRGNVKADQVGSPDKFISLLALQMNSYNPNDCHLCKSGIPMNTNLGKARK